MSTKKALGWCIFWVVLAAIFNAGVYYFKGPQSALEFLGGYIIEQSLSIDNLFLFLFIFSAFGITTQYQRRVLNYGILGAIILRLVFILAGVKIVNQFHWILYIFGLILIVSGIKMWFGNDSSDDNENLKNNWTLKLLKKIIPVTDSLAGEKFFIKLGKTLYATPLFAILVIIETSDLIFAVDSIPAVFSVSTDSLIVYSSNIFAILGLRNMYFLLEKSHRAFHLMKYGVALVLTFTGIKLSLLFFQIEIPLVTSISVIIVIITLSIIISVLFPPKTELQGGDIGNPSND